MLPQSRFTKAQLHFMRLYGRLVQENHRHHYRRRPRNRPRRRQCVAPDHARVRRREPRRNQEPRSS